MAGELKHVAAGALDPQQGVRRRAASRPRRRRRCPTSVRTLDGLRRRRGGPGCRANRIRAASSASAVAVRFGPVVWRLIVGADQRRPIPRAPPARRSSRRSRRRTRRTVAVLASAGSSTLRRSDGRLPADESSAPFRDSSRKSSASLIVASCVIGSVGGAGVERVVAGQRSAPRMARATAPSLSASQRSQAAWAPAASAPVAFGPRRARRWRRGRAGSTRRAQARAPRQVAPSAARARRTPASANRPSHTGHSSWASAGAAAGQRQLRLAARADGNRRRVIVRHGDS